jgi:hypothetical protein
MIIDPKIFIHIPKNAGTTVRLSPILKGRIIESVPQNHKSKEYSAAVKAHMDKIGDHHGYEHARWRDLKPTLTSAYDAFAVIRNPWSRVVSRYLFAKKVTEVEKKPDAPPGKYKINSLEHFLEERHEWGNMEYMWHRAIRGWYPQIDYVTDESGNIRCDCIRQEEFDTAIKQYFKLPSMDRHRNVTNMLKGDWKDLYNEKTIQIVGDWYQADIDAFGFDFDTPAQKNYWSL